MVDQGMYITVTCDICKDVVTFKCKSLNDPIALVRQVTDAGWLKRDKLDLCPCCLCSHPNVEKAHKSNTGNYDPTVDFYWIDLHCPDCDKRWREDQ